MSFWLDRFRRDDEEDIWEELRQILLNSANDEKNKEEQAWMDSVLEKAFPEEDKTQSEPYLTYEDLLGEVSKENLGELTGMAAPIQKGQVAYEKRLTPYEEIDAKKIGAMN